MSHCLRVRRFFLYTFLWKLNFTSTLWILYLIHIGWPLWQITPAEVAFHASALLAEVPTGAFADRHGWRRSLRIGFLIHVTMLGGGCSSSPSGGFSPVSWRRPSTP